MHKLFILLVITVFAFSVADKVTKRVGETVTLHPNGTKESLNNFLWTFGPNAPVEAIAIVTNREVTKVNGTRFGNRLQTTAHNGSITICNLTVGDSGIFYIQILTESGILKRTIYLTVQVYDELKNVVEGGNVTLETPTFKLEKKHRVIWRTGEGIEGKIIVQWINTFYVLNINFGDIVQFNHNGSLTFIRIPREYSGLYNVQILEDNEPHSRKCYNVTVYEPVSLPYFTTNITEIFDIGPSPSDKGCYVACSVKNGPDVNLTWFNGPTMISSVYDSMNVSMNLSLPLKIQPENKENFTCEARNPVTVERKTLSSTMWCPSHQPEGTRTWIWLTAVGVGLGLMILAIINIRRRNFRRAVMVRRENRQESPRNYESTSSMI
uniref:Ig-like domain-containing protein n=1 Tax=Poecilia reticulata TaxID=8081 RepID=A0A3P9N5U4_POERE